jgi:hypothetical protein
VTQLSRLKEYFVWKVFAAYSLWCRSRLYRALPGIAEEIVEYSGKSDTTGTKFPTLWRAVRIILKEKPSRILECGTGLSTLVLSAAILKNKAEDASYDGHIVSMESVEQWFDTAVQNLPEKYKQVVEIVLGPREKYEFLFFRGYRHSNIPPQDFDFVFLDGPNYDDENGGSFCADVLHVLEISSAPVVRGVIDTRVSSVFVMQTVFGTKAIRYYPLTRTSDFSVSRTPLRVKITSRNFRSGITGRVSFRPRSLPRERSAR